MYHNKVIQVFPPLEASAFNMQELNQMIPKSWSNRRLYRENPSSEYQNPRGVAGVGHESL